MRRLVFVLAFLGCARDPLPAPPDLARAADLVELHDVESVDAAEGGCFLVDPTCLPPDGGT